MASLFPGYVHVDHFGSDGEYESGEEEVSYVTLDLVQAEPQLIPQSSSYRLAGLDTPTPFLQLQGTTFRGEHAELLGSEIIFANGRDAANPSRRFVVPLGVTSTRIRFHEVSVNPLGSVEAAQRRPMTLSQKQTARRHARTARVVDSTIPRKRGPNKKKKKQKDEDESVDEAEEEKEMSIADEDEEQDGETDGGADSDDYEERRQPGPSSNPAPALQRASRKAKEKAKASVRAVAQAIDEIETEEAAEQQESS